MLVADSWQCAKHQEVRVGGHHGQTIQNDAGWEGMPEEASTEHAQSSALGTRPQRVKRLTVDCKSCQRASAALITVASCMGVFYKAQDFMKVVRSLCCPRVNFIRLVIICVQVNLLSAEYVCLATIDYQSKCHIVYIGFGWYPANFCLAGKFAKQYFLQNRLMKSNPGLWPGFPFEMFPLDIFDFLM